MRCGIETSFCPLKHAIGAINLHSKKREMITHKLWTRLILFNFCSVISAHAVSKCQKKKHIHQVNYTVAWQACHYSLRLHNAEPPPDIEDLIRQHTLLSDLVETMPASIDSRYTSASPIAFKEGRQRHHHKYNIFSNG